MRTAPGQYVCRRLREELEELCSEVYSNLSWYKNGIQPPLLAQIDDGRRGEVLFARKEGRIVAAHGFLDMREKVRLTSWAPAALCREQQTTAALLELLVQRARLLGKNRAVYVLRGEPSGEDARWWLRCHEVAGFEQTMIRLDMQVATEDISVASEQCPNHICWDEVETHALEPFLELYARVFGTSESPLARSWSQQPDRLKWWFERVLEGEEGELIPGGWLSLSKANVPIGLLLVTMKPGANAHVADVGVIREERGRGYGRLLMRKAVEIAIANKAGCLSLGVEAQNKPAIRLYESMGFRALSRTSVCIRRFR